MQLIQLTITDRRDTPVIGGSMEQGFDVEDIVSPIIFNSTDSKSYFVARTNKGGVNDNHNGSKINYRSSEDLATIKAKSPMLLLLDVISRRGVAKGEQYIFVANKISESLSVDPSGTKFFYVEDGDPLPVEYIVEQAIDEIIDQNSNGVVAGSAPVSITWPELKVLELADSFVPGTTYKITDRFNYQSGGSGTVPNQSFIGDDRGIVYVKALTTNTLEKQVTRIMAVPNGYGVTVGSGFPTDPSIGVWHPTKTSALGDYAIRGARLFSNITGNIGTADNENTLDSTNWLPQPKGLSVYYIDKQFVCLYDFDNDWFEEQRDGNGSEVGVSYQDTIDYYVISFNPCDITDWNMSYGLSTTSSFYQNKQPLGVYNNLSQYIITNISLIDGGTINSNGNTGDIYNNSGSIVSNNNTSKITNNSKSIYSLDNTITNCDYDQLYNTVDGYEIDITGLTTINIPASYQDYLKEVILNSTTPNDTIDTITNMPTKGKRINFVPKTGVITTFTPIGGNLLLEGTIPATINGSNQDSIEFETGLSGKVKMTNGANY